MNSEKSSVNRILGMDLPLGQTAFLWGARKTGKSTYLRQHFPRSVVFDLLDSDLFFRWSSRPALFREAVLALTAKQLKYPIIVDEVQFIPALLNEIHWLIEHTKAYFILCGSSARKLKKAGTNLLGGRAWRFSFYPFVFPELPDLELLKVFQQGLIPSHYLSRQSERALQAYVQDYLHHEIQMEGLVRNLPDFSRFLSSFAFSNGELTNFSNIARDCGIDSKTVKAYYQILVDTLLGYFVLPFTSKTGRQTLSEVPKFYLFDVGVANFLANRHVLALKGAEAGKSFEHYILTEMMAYKGIHEKRFDIRFWRTRSGLEVDFVLGEGQVAIEVKISDCVQTHDLKGLTAYLEDFPHAKAIVVSLDPRPRLIKTALGDIRVLPWRQFLNELWKGKLGL